MTTRAFVVSCGVMAAGWVSAQGAVIGLDAYDLGWYEWNGTHNPANQNYTVGDTIVVDPFTEDHRDFFVYDLRGVTQDITAAHFELYLSGYNSDHPFETFVLRQISTPLGILLAGQGGVAAYNDLADGTVYGSHNFTLSQQGHVNVLPMNAAFLEALNAARGGLFAMGGSISTLDSNPATREQLFGDNSAGNARLVFTVPGPSVGGLGVIAWVGIGMGRRRRGTR